MLHALFALVLAIDPSHSTASFSVSHVFVERVSGTVGITQGTIDVPAAGAIPTSVRATLDARTLKTDDSDRDASLKGPDWFDAGAYPAWTFESTAIVPTAGGFTAKGLLTIHGVAQPETMAVSVSGTPEHPIYHATCTVDRHAFGMKTNRLDPVIGNAVDVTLDIHIR